MFKTIKTLMQLKSLFFLKDLYEVFELIKLRLTDPKKNPAVPSNKADIDNKIFAIITRGVNKASLLIITLIIGFVIVSALTDPKGVWLQIRELLLQGKDILKPDPDELIVPKKINIIDRIDAFAMRIFNVFMTTDNYVWLLNKAVYISEVGLNAFIKVSTWTVEHWPAVLLFLIAGPFAYYFNFIFIRTIKDAFIKVFNETYQSVVNSLGTLSTAIHKLGKVFTRSLDNTLGVFVKVICFPANVAIWLTTKTLGGVNFVSFTRRLFPTYSPLSSTKTPFKGVFRECVKTFLLWE